jgi:hypothetical protein
MKDDIDTIKIKTMRFSFDNTYLVQLSWGDNFKPSQS